ncbi:hypothetical protein V8G54_035599 [Vigna mungo]|uniref:SHSP domain-containing protein n=1 Tax=Vigna mungo TaxID=3915 RepID=A0AAQ3RFU1_VIGMU
MSIYQDVEAKYDTEESPESIILRVHLPDGFAREHVGAKVEYGFTRVRVHGERSLGNNIRVRFNTSYQVPDYCDMNKIKGKFDGKTVTITIPTIPHKVPKKETQEPPKEPPQETEANNTVDENQDASTPADDNHEKTKSTNENEEQVDHENENATHQKGQGEVEEKSAITQVKSEKPVDQEKSTPTKDTEESKSQEGQEETPPKDDSTKVDHDGSTSTSQEHTKESMPQKGQEETPQEATFSTNDKLQGKEESEEEHSKKGLESGKANEKDEEIKEGKGFRTFEGDKMNGKIGNDVGDKNDEKTMPESTRSRIKEVAASASQAVTGLAKRFNEEDKQKIMYMGAAVLVVALGVYATYKLRSRRP